ncbi:protein of unknown function [Kyrpidia spormannii]|uniref:Uncharacterized protein n=1 Tax=Kyrpidia spormannii TaxID=2055160 RepID=A0ACA8Z6I3_9BACL|nr:protein of unknown function [Kyrpidia spormannii]
MSEKGKARDGKVNFPSAGFYFWQKDGVCVFHVKPLCRLCVYLTFLVFLYYRQWSLFIMRWFEGSRKLRVELAEAVHLFSGHGYERRGHNGSTVKSGRPETAGGKGGVVQRIVGFRSHHGCHSCGGVGRSVCALFAKRMTGPSARQEAVDEKPSVFRV